MAAWSGTMRRISASRSSFRVIDGATAGGDFIKLLKLMFSRLRILDGKSYRKVYFMCSFYLYFIGH